MVAPLATFAASLAAGAVKSMAAQAAGGLGAKSATADPKAAADARARKTATDFEAMFLEQTVDRMFSGMGEDGPLGENGPGGGVYRSMLAKEYAGQMVRTGGVGIGRQVYAEMLRMQEASKS
jgi:Rod binding domain-containing protein